MGWLPAETHEEGVVRLGSELNSSQESHRSVLLDGLVELHHVQVLHGDPPKYRPIAEND